MGQAVLKPAPTPYVWFRLPRFTRSHAIRGQKVLVAAWPLSTVFSPLQFEFLSRHMICLPPCLQSEFFPHLSGRPLRIGISLDLPSRRPSSQAGRQGFNHRLQLLDLKPYSPIRYLISKHLPLGPRWTSKRVSSWTSPAGRQTGILYLILIMGSGCPLDGDRLRSEKSGTASWA